LRWLTLPSLDRGWFPFAIPVLETEKTGIDLRFLNVVRLHYCDWTFAPAGIKTGEMEKVQQ
jgi:hypothetical protein